MNPKKNKKTDRRKLAARILAGILAFLMVAGTAYYMIYMLVITLSAAGTGNLQEDLNIRIGLKYGDGAPKAFYTETPYGYVIGSQPLGDDVYDFVPYMETDRKNICVAVDGNLKRTENSYEAASGTSAIAVGGYHIELSSGYTPANIMYAVHMGQTLDSILSSLGYYSFPVYKNGEIRLRIGSFSTQNNALAAYAGIASIIGNQQAAVAEPSSTAVSVIDTETNRILFEYDCSDGTSLGLTPRQTGTEEVYFKTQVGNVYDGVFAYLRYRNEKTDGVSVVNVLTLDEYVSGVLPFETSNSWPMEALKANAIAIRSYAAFTLDKHEKSYSFDLCNSDCCQVYSGNGRVNESIRTAVESTHGLILTYNDRAACSLYSAGSGNSRVAVGDIWGGSNYPYMPAISTPWEQYTERSKTFWTVEYSPTELYNKLKDNQYCTELSGAIKSVEILEFSEGSTYVTKLRITDIKGKSVVLENTERIRKALGLRSANFVAGQGSVIYTLEKVETGGETVLNSIQDKQVLPPVSNAGTGTLSPVVSSGVQTVLTASGLQTVLFDKTVVLTDAGKFLNNAQQMYVRSAGGTVKISTAAAPSTGGPGTFTVKNYSVTTTLETAYASSPQNFIFVGKGNGHGGGMSQWGSKDLADLGYGYEQIINAYYKDVEIEYYKTVKGLR